MSTFDLLPCPFCDGLYGKPQFKSTPRAPTKPGVGVDILVHYPTCGATGPHHYWPGDAGDETGQRQWSGERWNRRAEFTLIGLKAQLKTNPALHGIVQTLLNVTP